MNYQFTVKKSERGKNLQAFLYEKLPDWSHKRVKQAIDNKRAFVNDKSVFISKWNLKPGDRVRFLPQKDDYPGAQPTTGSGYHYIDVIYEDEVLLVTNKRAHMDYDSFVGHVNAYLKRGKKHKYYPYLGQMHRLDKETSGLLMFTKKKVANVLAQQFRNRKIKKDYYALVWGRVPKENQIIKKKLLKKKFDGGKKVEVTKSQSGLEAVTEYWVQERYDQATLLKVRIGTGRTHQIRVHLASIGHPLVGDKTYGLDDLTPAMKKLAQKAKRQLLHAQRIEFHHPLSGKKMQLTAPFPQDFDKIVDGLRESC